MISPANIGTKTYRVSFSDEVGADGVNRTALDRFCRIEHYHFTLDHIGEVGLAESMFFPKAKIPNSKGHPIRMLGGVLVGLCPFKWLEIRNR